MVKLTYHGHSCFLIESGGHKLLIDPFITGNRLAKVKPEGLGCDYILLSHGHNDHFGDTLQIAKANNATVIAPFELAVFCEQRGCKVHPMQIGGSHDFDFGRLKLTIAHHSSAYEMGDSIHYTGNPCGFVLTLDKKKIYHSGDTGLFMDMQLIGKKDKLDLALIPIGGNFTMDIDDAVEAVRFLKPKMAVPMHYDTFDLIKQDPLQFAKKLKSTKTKAKIVKPGESFTI
ncbi:MAG: metal-dependent hydrolase [candidate division Zixibacteria bacterium]|nr:metal-dependent hydrolase [candidate division Zixibacteria bacterium]